DKTRSIRADSLFFDNNGNIKKVLPTLRGVGISSAYNEIQFDRYSSVNGSGVRFEYLDAQDTFKGWMLVFTDPDATVRYNKVDFDDNSHKGLFVYVTITRESKGSLEVRDASGDVIAQTSLNPDERFKAVTIPIDPKLTGVKDLLLELKGKGVIQIDWLQFV